MDQITPKEVANGITAEVEREEERRTSAINFVNEAVPLLATGWEIGGTWAIERLSGLRVPRLSIQAEKREYDGFAFSGSGFRTPTRELDTIPEVLEFATEFEMGLASVGV